jgi:O-antigen/teichoic acid export membrane protein
VPILLFANIFLGIFYNLSVWYKLSGKTKYGAYIASIGAVITIILNIILIPKIGYTGSAWATFICYGTMVIISYFYGRKYFRINYPLKMIFFYLITAFILYLVSAWTTSDLAPIMKYGINSLILVSFLALILVLEKPKKALISRL